MITASMLVCTLVFGQVSSPVPQVTFAQYSCPCGSSCPCSPFAANCGGTNCPGNSRQNFRPQQQQQQQGNFCGPNGCQTVTQYRSTIPNAVNYGSCANGSCANGSCANANTCGPNGCSNAQVNNRFYNYPRYRTRTYRRFRIFRRW